MKKKDIKIPRPSISQVKYFLREWDSYKNKNYRLQESSLGKLFKKTYPLNKELDDVLIKVCSLKTLYAVKIYNPLKVARHIVNLKIDESLEKNDLKIVNKIADIEMKKGRRINFYSFATKYCSHHKPNIYPIYDYYVEKMLMHFKHENTFHKFVKKNLKSFKSFREIIIGFREYYGLTQFSLKEIDQYLWLAGKRYFKRTY